MAVIGMASCSKDEPTSVNTGDAIDFRAAMGTRVSETNTGNLSSFYVTALEGSAGGSPLFENEEFTKNGTSFGSSTSYYWPTDNSSLYFYAYAPSKTDLGGTLTISGSTKTLANFSPASAIKDQKDFITASASGNKSVNESNGVALTFAHQLSQIEIRAKNSNASYVYKVKGVRIGKPVSKGTFNIGTSGWTLLATDKAIYTTTYDTAITLNGTAASIMGTDGNAMLIPQQLTAWTPITDGDNTDGGAYLSVYVNIETKSGANVYPSTEGGYAWASVAIGTTWAAGQKYIYTLDFTNGAGRIDPEGPGTPGEPILGDPIIFTNVTVGSWSDAAQDVAL